MAIRSESNFPNSRITAALQGYNVDNPAELLFVGAQSVSGKSALMVQIAQQSGNPLVTNANLNQYQGMSSFNISNAFVPEAYNKIKQVRTPTTDRFQHYVGETFICCIVVKYLDSNKVDLDEVVRENTP